MNYLGGKLRKNIAIRERLIKNLMILGKTFDKMADGNLLKLRLSVALSAKLISYLYKKK